MSVAGALHRTGHDIAWFDQDPDLDRIDRSDSLREALASTSLAFVWMNELDPLVQTGNALRLCQRMKEWYPELKVALGGSFITVVPSAFLRVESPFDFFIQGYGEDACPALLDALAGDRSLDSVPGLVWKSGPEGGWHANPPSTGRLHAEDLAFYSALDLSEYRQRGGIFGNDQDTFVIGTARGCAKHCRFCYWSNHPLTLLPPRPLVDVVLDMHRRYGVKQFHLAELDFFASKERVLAFADLWRERLPGCTWFTLASPVDVARFTEAELDRLAAGGLKKLELGTESGSEHVLAAIGKQHRPSDPLGITEKLLARGVATMHNFIFGFVGETRADRERSFDLILGLHALDPRRVFFTFRFFQPPWGTPMGDEAIARSADAPRSLDELMAYRPRFGDPDVHAMGWLDADVEREIKHLVYDVLPLMTSRHTYAGFLQRALYELLRNIARLRVTRRCFRWPVDTWLYRTLLGASLDNTYRA